MRLEGLCKFKIQRPHRDLPACSIAPQSSALSQNDQIKEHKMARARSTSGGEEKRM
jgi:hypothetical protein